MKSTSARMFGLPVWGGTLCLLLPWYWWWSDSGPYHWLIEWQTQRYGLSLPLVTALGLMLLLLLGCGLLYRALVPSSRRQQAASEGDDAWDSRHDYITHSMGPVPPRAE